MGKTREGKRVIEKMHKQQKKTLVLTKEKKLFNSVRDSEGVDGAGVRVLDSNKHRCRHQLIHPLFIRS